MSNVKRGAVRTPVRDSGGTLSHCGICAAGFPAALTKIENFPDWGGAFARMTQVPLRPWPGWLNLYRAWHLPNSADLQSADVARGAFLLMVQLADAREESLWWCSPQRVSVILLLSSHCGGSSTAVANDVHRGGFVFRHSAAALPSSYVIPLRRSSATGSRNRRTALYCRQADSVSAVEKSDGAGRYGQAEKYVAVGKTCARRFLRKRPCRRL